MGRKDEPVVREGDAVLEAIRQAVAEEEIRQRKVREQEELRRQGKK